MYLVFGYVCYQIRLMNLFLSPLQQHRLQYLKAMLTCGLANGICNFNNQSINRTPKLNFCAHKFTIFFEFLGNLDIAAITPSKSRTQTPSFSESSTSLKARNPRGSLVFPEKISDKVDCPHLHSIANSCCVQPLSISFSRMFLKFIRQEYRNSDYLSSGISLSEFGRVKT